MIIREVNYSCDLQALVEAVEDVFCDEHFPHISVFLPDLFEQLSEDSHFDFSLIDEDCKLMPDMEDGQITGWKAVFSCVQPILCDGGSSWKRSPDQYIFVLPIELTAEEEKYLCSLFKVNAMDEDDGIAE